MLQAASRSRLNRSRLLWVLGQAAIVALLVCFYFGVRGLTASSYDVALRHSEQIVALEKALGIYVEDDLQDMITGSDMLVNVANWVYMWGHWPVIIVTMIWLARWHSDVFVRLRDAMAISGALGMMIFVSWPLAPPRLAELGMVDTVTERSYSYRVLQPPAFVNQYAAMPSLHAGWDLLVGMAIFTAASTTLLRAVGVMMPVLMVISVVVTANHYILDVVAGVTLVLIGHAVALRLERRRQGRRAEQAERARQLERIT
jgi:membrane-associated phospholipid phosphatase